MPVSPETIVRARRGELSLLLTPYDAGADGVARSNCVGRACMGLASAGGQQGPRLGGGGGRRHGYSTIRRQQLSRDRDVARATRGFRSRQSKAKCATCRVSRTRVSISFFIRVRIVSCRPSGRCGARPHRRVEARRGICSRGFVNPVVFALDLALEREGIVQLKYKFRFRSWIIGTTTNCAALRASGEPLAFGHTLEDQIGGAAYLTPGFSSW